MEWELLRSSQFLFDISFMNKMTIPSKLRLHRSFHISEARMAIPFHLLLSLYIFFLHFLTSILCFSCHFPSQLFLYISMYFFLISHSTLSNFSMYFLLYFLSPLCLISHSASTSHFLA